MEKKLYESPEMEVISFVAEERLAAGDGLDNETSFGGVPDGWDGLLP